MTHRIILCHSKKATTLANGLMMKRIFRVVVCCCKIHFQFQVTIRTATGLPPSLSHFVFCQYVFWGDTDTITVPPLVHPDQSSQEFAGLGSRVGSHVTNDVAMFTFNHTSQFCVPVTEEFMEHCSEGALSIEVYGHRSAGFATTAKLAERHQLAKSLADRLVVFAVS